MSKEYPVEMTHTADFENYAEGFVDGGMGASRLVRQSYDAEISRLKEKLEEAKASASALRQLMQERQWRPINEAEHYKEPTGEYDTYPELLLWMGGRAHIGQWNPDRYVNKPKPHWVTYGNLGKAWCRHNQPTHWQPLPNPPSESPHSGDTDPSTRSDGVMTP